MELETIESIAFQKDFYLTKQDLANFLLFIHPASNIYLFEKKQIAFNLEKAISYLLSNEHLFLEKQLIKHLPMTLNITNNIENARFFAEIQSDHFIFKNIQFFEQISNSFAKTIEFHNISYVSYENIQFPAALTFTAKNSHFDILPPIPTLLKANFINCPISSYQFDPICTQIKHIILQNCQLQAASFLQKLDQLEYLDIQNNVIIDFSFLKNLKKLIFLNISNMKRPEEWHSIDCGSKAIAISWSKDGDYDYMDQFDFLNFHDFPVMERLEQLFCQNSKCIEFAPKNKFPALKYSNFRDNLLTKIYAEEQNEIQVSGISLQTAEFRNCQYVEIQKIGEVEIAVFECENVRIQTVQNSKLIGNCCNLLLENCNFTEIDFFCDTVEITGNLCLLTNFQGLKAEEIILDNLEINNYIQIQYLLQNCKSLVIKNVKFDNLEINFPISLNEIVSQQPLDEQLFFVKNLNNKPTKMTLSGPSLEAHSQRMQNFSSFGYNELQRNTERWDFLVVLRCYNSLTQ